MRTQANIKTRIEEKGTAHPTAVTFDWTGVTPDQVREYAQRQVIVTLQAQFRRDGTRDGTVPPKHYECRVAEIMSGARRALTPEEMLELVLANPEMREKLRERAAALEEGGNEEDK